jgi:hypothetical protein
MGTELASWLDRYELKEHGSCIVLRCRACGDRVALWWPETVVSFRMLFTEVESHDERHTT